MEHVGNMKPLNSPPQANVASRGQALFLTSIIATFCIDTWLAATALVGSSSLGFLATFFNWIASRGIKEWLLAWLCMWGATLTTRHNWWAKITILLCALSLVVFEQGSIYLSFTPIRQISPDFFLYLAILSLLELCILYWMYAGVLLALSISRACVIASDRNPNDPNSQDLLHVKQRARRTLRNSFIVTSVFSLLLMMLWTVFSWGRLPPLTSILLFSQGVFFPTLFRFVCGLSVAGLVYIFGPTDRRKKTGIAILVVASLVVVLHSTYTRAWGVSLFPAGNIWPISMSITTLLTFPIMIALSPVGGFALCLPLLRLHGYRIEKLQSATSSTNNMPTTDRGLIGPEYTNDPEMYL